MVLNNMKKYLKNLSIFGFPTKGGANDVLVTIRDTLVDTSGNAITKMIIGGTGTSNSIYNCNPFSHFANASSSSNSSLLTTETPSTVSTSTSQFMFGKGTTPVTEDDYCLDNPITSGITIPSTDVFSYSQKYSLSEDGNTMTRTVTLNFAIQNTTTADITITEIGFYEPVLTGSSAKELVMMHRELFDAPVVLVPSAYGTFEFEFVFTNSVA